MQIAILSVSSLALACSLGTLILMKRTADDIRSAKVRLDSEMDEVKTKVNHNAKVIKAAVAAMEV